MVMLAWIVRQLPLHQWGFEPNEWGFPATPLWQQHATNLAKEQLHELWMKQITRLRSDETAASMDAAAAEVAGCDGEDESAGIAPFTSEGNDDLEQDRPTGPVVATPTETQTATETSAATPTAAPASVSAAAIAANSTDASATAATAAADHTAKQATGAGPEAARSDTATAGDIAPNVNLQDKDAVRGAPLLQVVEELSVAMAKHYLSELLPTSTPCAGDNGSIATQSSVGFDGKKRAEWVQEMVASASMGKACEQLAFFKLAAQHRCVHPARSKI